MNGVPLTKEMATFGAALLIAGSTVLVFTGGGTATGALPAIPPVEEPLEVSALEVPVVKPPLTTAPPKREGRDPFATASVWEVPDPEPIAAPPERQLGLLIPLIELGGGRGVLPRAVRLDRAALGLFRDPDAAPEGSDDFEDPLATPADDGEGSEDSEAGSPDDRFADPFRRRRRGAPDDAGEPGAELPPDEGLAEGIADLEVMPASLVALLGDAGPDELTASLRLFDILKLTGKDEPIEGELLEETAESYVFRRKGSQSAIPYSRSLVEEVVRADRPEHVYKRERDRLTDTDGAGHYRLARFCARHGLLRGARDEALKAARVDGTLINAYRLAAAVVRIEYGKVSPQFHADVRDRELKIYEQADAAGSLEPDLRLAKARLLREEGAREAALAELNRVLADLPRTGDGLYDPALGAEELGSAMALEASLELGDLALGLGRHAEAIAAYQAVAGEATVAVRAYTGLGLAQVTAGDLAAAAAAFDAARLADPDHPEAHVLLAGVAILQGRTDDAAYALREAKRKGDKGIEREALHGLLLALNGKVQDGLAPVDTVLAVDPAAQLQLVRGFLSELAGDQVDAVTRYERVRDGAGRLGALAAFAMADLFARANEPARAQDALEEAARLGYDFGSVALAIARLERAHGSVDRAIRFARYAETASPADADAAYDTGLTYLQASIAARRDHEAAAGFAGEAEAAFRRVSALEPGSVRAIAARGRVRYGLGDFDTAESLFRAALELDPKHAYAQGAITQLETARSRRVWRDGFERPNAAVVRNRWLEDERFGVDVALQGGKLLLQGTQANEAFGTTRVTRELDGERFVELRVRLEIAAAEARVGLEVQAASGAVRIYRDLDGRLYGRIRTGAREWDDAIDLGPWPGSGAHSLSIAVAGSSRAEVVFRLNDAEVGREKTNVLQKRGRTAASVFTEAVLGASLHVTADDAAVFISR